MHGAAIAFDGAAYLFTAPSGTGKTTHVRLWRQYLGSRVTVVNGDKPFLSLEPDGTVRVWGSPWAGKERWQSPISVPLCGVCLLERGTDRICRLPPEQALAQYEQHLNQMLVLEEGMTEITGILLEYDVWHRYTAGVFSPTYHFYPVWSIYTARSCDQPAMMIHALDGTEVIW